MPKVNLGSDGPKPKHKKQKPLIGTRPRYARGETVKGGTDVRARKRLERVGPIKGVDTTDGITGGEARKIKRVAANQPVKKRVQQKQRKPQAPADPYDSQVNSLAQLQFGPQERQLSQRRAQEQQFGVNQQGYYAQHQQDMLLAQTKLQAYQQGVQAASYGAAQNAATTDQTQNNTMLQQAQASAAQRGTTVDPSLAGTLNAGVAARQVMGNAGGDLIGAQGQANAAYGVNQMQQAGEQGIQAQQDTQNRQRKIDQLAQDLLSDRGAFKVKTRADLQAADHKSALEDAAFGVSTQNTLADNRRADRTERRQSKSDRALQRDRKIDNRRQDRSENRQQRNTDSLITDRQQDNARQERKDRRTLKSRGLSKRDPDGDGIANSGKYRGYSEPERDKFDTAVGTLGSHADKTAKDPQGALNALIHEEHIPPRIAHRAMRRFMQQRRKHRGSLTPRNPDGTPG